MSVRVGSKTWLVGVFAVPHVLHWFTESSSNLSPLNLQATFVRESPEKEEVDLLEAEEEVEFQAPLPVAPKRTKPVKNSKMYNADGELISSQPQASKRTKVLTGKFVV